MQVYKYMDIGTAKPDLKTLQSIKHHLINILNPDTQFSTGDFVTRALPLIHEITERNNIPVISGGTAFYFKNLMYGLPEAPPQDPKVRARVQEELMLLGAEELYNKLKLVDAESANRIHINDHYRITRALEVFYTCNRPLSSFKMNTSFQKGIDYFSIGLERDRKELYQRIDERVELMFQMGLSLEIQKIKDLGYTQTDPGMQAIGYKEFFDFEHEGLSEIKKQIQTHSRNYAKRQLTFFKSFPSIHWIHPDNFSLVLEELIDFFR